jgi:hypothetical protein
MKEVLVATYRTVTEGGGEIVMMVSTAMRVENPVISKLKQLPLPNSHESWIRREKRRVLRIVHITTSYAVALRYCISLHRLVQIISGSYPRVLFYRYRGKTT